MKDPGILRWKDGVCGLLTGPGLGIEVSTECVRGMASKGHGWHNLIWRDIDGIIAGW